MASSEPPFVGPKYPNVEESHKYGPVPLRHAPDREMMGPVYPGVDPSNRFDIVSTTFFIFNCMTKSLFLKGLGAKFSYHP